MKIKDLDKNEFIVGKKVKTHEGIIGYWHSQWGYPDGKAGVWLKSSPDDTQIYPQFLDKLKDALEWEITEEECNCHIK